MTCEEFSNEFDLLYNNIMSNQAPGLDEYEKSVFLTRAQDDIVKRYFTPKGNKDYEGFDSSLKRNVDFSTLYRTYTYKCFTEDDIDNIITCIMTAIGDLLIGKTAKKYNSTGEVESAYSDKEKEKKAGYECYYTITSQHTLYVRVYDLPKVVNDSLSSYPHEAIINDVGFYIGTEDNTKDDIESIIFVDSHSMGYFSTMIKESLNNKSTFGTINIQGVIVDTVNKVNINYYQDADIFIPINDQLTVLDKVFNKERYLQIVPLTSTDYIRLMSKPFQNPPKNQAWKIQSEATTKVTSALLIYGYNNVFRGYTLRYLKHPSPIILTNLEDANLSINGQQTPQTCALSDEIHSEILQRAVELAKAAYTGDLGSAVRIGDLSSTNMGQTQAPQQAQQYRQQ